MVIILHRCCVFLVRFDRFIILTVQMCAFLKKARFLLKVCWFLFYLKGILKTWQNWKSKVRSNIIYVCITLLLLRNDHVGARQSNIFPTHTEIKWQSCWMKLYQLVMASGAACYENVLKNCMLLFFCNWYLIISYGADCIFQNKSLKQKHVCGKFIITSVHWGKCRIWMMGSKHLCGVFQ